MPVAGSIKVTVTVEGKGVLPFGKDGHCGDVATTAVPGMLSKSTSFTATTGGGGGISVVV